jgi:UDP-2,3-diacylglucosamine hydrolase
VPQSGVYIEHSTQRLEQLPERIGLIAGEGNFPITLAKAAAGLGVKVVAFGVHGYAHDGLAGYCEALYNLKLTEMSRLIELGHKHGIRHLVMAGRVPHNILLLRQISFDPRILKLLASLPNRKADSLLLAAVSELEKEGFKVLNSTIFLKSCMPKAGLLTPRVRPTKAIIKDIEFAFPLAKELGRLDIGQSIAVKDQIVVAVEALEGTDQMIKRCYELAGEGVVIVKVSKPRQDMRFDVPVIGLTTIRNLAAARAAALCITADESLFFDQKESVSLAEQNRIAIVARPNDRPITDVL